MTDQQRAAIKRIHALHDIKMPLHLYYETAQPEIGWPDSLIIKANDMVIGIEPDGYTHT